MHPFPPLVFASRRSSVYAPKAMVAASQPLAVEAGLSVLRQGGTAADAAVAVAAVLAVTEPGSTGLGGDAFALYFDAESQKTYALNGSGRAPAGLTLDKVISMGLGGGLPVLSPLAITVPGACAAWCDLSERFGRLGLAPVLQKAASLASEGFAVGPVTAQAWHEAEGVLQRTLGGLTLLVDNQRAPRPGELFTNPGMAWVLGGLAGAGSPQAARGWFYKGEPAERIAEIVQESGGVLDAYDMAEHRSEWSEPIEVEFMGRRVQECPPNGQGLAALIALATLREYAALNGREALGEPGSALRLHVQIEALRLAFADVRLHAADPDVYKAPLETLLSPDYARERAALIDPGRATADVRSGAPVNTSETVQFSIVDEQGNACSMVNSIYQGFGTGIVPQEMGFALHNRGLGFSLDPEHPGALAPGKRPYHTIIPGMLLHADGTLCGPFGVMGRFMQPQGHVQVLMSLLVDGCDPQTALDAPRFCIEVEGDGDILLEEGASAGASLAAMGHKLRPVSGYARAVFGRGQIILRDPGTGVLAAGSDPRADGLALGY
jgi:gamma-glutamyltranspeptidase/glutathione hydrolase